ncbi:hypothetical protein ACFE04_029980 [Oxalis oulophora]
MDTEGVDMAKEAKRKRLNEITCEEVVVQHLIEKCLIFHMSKEECMEALSKHANIKPVITSTVWKELEKENKEFFEAYAQSKSTTDRMSEEETSQMIQKMISDSSSSTKDSPDHPN